MTGFRNPPLRFSLFFVISHAHKDISQYFWWWQSCLCFIHTEKGLLLWVFIEDEHVPVLLPKMWNNWRGASTILCYWRKISWASNQPGSPARRTSDGTLFCSCCCPGTLALLYFSTFWFTHLEFFFSFLNQMFSVLTLRQFVCMFFPFLTFDYYYFKIELNNCALPPLADLPAHLTKISEHP